MQDRDCSILKHIINYCNKLLNYTKDMSYSDFVESELHRDACALCILQIGELVYNLTDTFKEKNDNIPWKQIRAMRNIVAHHYGVVDSETVWEVIKGNIPDLKEFCENAIKSIVNTAKN